MGFPYAISAVPWQNLMTNFFALHLQVVVPLLFELKMAGPSHPPMEAFPQGFEKMEYALSCLLIPLSWVFSEIFVRVLCTGCFAREGEKSEPARREVGKYGCFTHTCGGSDRNVMVMWFSMAILQARVNDFSESTGRLKRVIWMTLYECSLLHTSLSPRRARLQRAQKGDTPTVGVQPLEEP